MKEESRKELLKISRVSAVIKWLSMFLLIVSIIMLIFNIYAFIDFPGENVKLYVTRELTIHAKEQGNIIGIIPAGTVKHLYIWTTLGHIYLTTFIIFVIKLLVCFQKQMVFTKQSIYFSKWIVWLYMVYVALISFIIPNFLLSEGHMELTGTQIFAILVMWMFIWMLQVGRVLRLDSEMTI